MKVIKEKNVLELTGCSNKFHIIKFENKDDVDLFLEFLKCPIAKEKGQFYVWSSVSIYRIKEDIFLLDTWNNANNMYGYFDMWLKTKNTIANTKYYSVFSEGEQDKLGKDLNECTSEGYSIFHLDLENVECISIKNSLDLKS